jgi:hypothetical protein
MASLSEVNQSWNAFYSEDDTSLKSMTIPMKRRVSFANDGKPERVHHIIAWSHAYRQARRGGWDAIVADRFRFQRRIHQSESCIGKVFDGDKRLRMLQMLEKNEGVPQKLSK